MLFSWRIGLSYYLQNYWNFVNDNSFTGSIITGTFEKRPQVYPGDMWSRQSLDISMVWTHSFLRPVLGDKDGPDNYMKIRLRGAIRKLTTINKSSTMDKENWSTFHLFHDTRRSFRSEFVESGADFLLAAAASFLQDL